MSVKILDKAADTVGGRRQLAGQIGVSRQVLEYWIKNRVPAEYVLKVENLTGISRHKLRPDIYGKQA